MTGLLRTATDVFMSAVYKLPEGPLKQALRQWLLRLKPGYFSKRFFVTAGDTAVIVGTPDPERVHQFATLTQPGGRTIIFEPAPANVERLRDAAADYPHVTVDDRGLWRSAGQQTLQLASPDNPGDHKIDVEGVEHDNDYREENYIDEVTIDVETLDGVLAEYGIDPDYVEIMVNGAEQAILDGATETLERSGAKFWVKGHARDETGRPLNRVLCDQFESFGYRTVISKGGQETVGEIDDWERRGGDVYAWKPA